MDNPVERSERLLERYLTAEQRRTLENELCFYVDGSDGCRYRIEGGACFNVVQMRPGQGIKCTRMCATIPGAPLWDTLLAQMLCLSTNAEAFLGRAVKSRG